MIYKLVETLNKTFDFKLAKAHCDIPCGIYDPHQAQVAALSVIRMIDLMHELAETHSEYDMEYSNTISRYIAVKEEHAELCKREVRVIWGDYFKQEHLDKHPEIHDLAHKIMRLGSKCRQTADRDTAVQLLKSLNRFAEIFWETNGVSTKKAKTPYKPEEEVVYPVL